MKEKFEKYFAYEKPRLGQMQLAQKVYESLIERKHLILQAPTGFGKTAGVLAGLLPFLKEREARAYYVVRTHREAEVVLRELERIRSFVRFPFHAAEIRGKKHMCHLASRVVETEIIDRYCQKLVKEGKCPFYLCLRGGLSDLKSRDDFFIFSSQDAIKMAVATGACAYHLLKKYLNRADLIIMPYQYITLDHLRRDIIRPYKGRLNLVIDECVTGDSIISIGKEEMQAKHLFRKDIPNLRSARLRSHNLPIPVKNSIITKRTMFSDDVIKIRTESGRSLKLTRRTRVLESRGESFKWKPAGTVSKGSNITVFEDDGFFEEKVTEVSGPLSGFVYDFVTFPDHNYLANGIVVHNSHNMPFVITEDRSSRLKIIEIEEALVEVYFLDKSVRSIILQLIRFLKEIRRQETIILSPLKFVEEIERRLDGISFDMLLQIIEKSATIIQDQMFSSNAIMWSSLARVAEFLGEVYRRRLSESYFLQYVGSELFADSYLELSSFNSSAIGKRIFRNFDCVIHVSGTNEWEEAYVALTGVPLEYNKFVIDPPFNEENIFLVTLENMSSRQIDRTEDNFNTFSLILTELVNTVVGRTALYFPSFEVLSAFKEIGFEKLVEKNILWENEGMDTKKHMEMISRFISSHEEDCLLVGVMGGRSAEGVDFGPGLLKCVIIFGVPFPEPSPKMKKYVEYLNRMFKGKGELYGYSYPAITKAAQALGRAFRSPEDRVSLILADDRYFNYGLFERFPAWIRRCFKGRYKDHIQLKQDLEKFFMLS